MGDTAAATLSEIAAARQRLESDIDALAARVPERDVLVDRAKVYGGAAAGAGLGLIGLVVSLKKRSATKERQRFAHETAAAIAEILDEVPVRRTADPDRVRSRPAASGGSSSRTGPVALVAVLAGIAIAVVTRLKGA